MCSVFLCCGCVQARACLSTKTRVTVVFLTLTVLGQGGGGEGSQMAQKHIISILQEATKNIRELACA